ncbi:MAG: SDR family oxidoreductase [Ignavibacteria bacterium]|jgi:NAD(P)H dehydrogenase (quinone)
MGKILVTGATGSLGTEVINSLLKRTDTANIAALARDLSKTETLKEKGIEIREGNYDNFNSLLQAFKDIDKLYFISGSDITVRVKQHENVVKAAKDSGVKHIVYTSFARKNETETSPIVMVAEAHLKTENWLKESGLTYTILKHNLYMDIIPMFIGEKVLETGLIYLPAGDGKTAFATRKDMAEAAAVILTTYGHENKEYDIASDKVYTFKEVAVALSEVTGKAINYVSPTQEEYTKTLSEASVPAEYIGAIAGFAEAVKQGEFEQTSGTIETLTGNKPTSLVDFLKKVYAS